MLPTILPSASRSIPGPRHPARLLVLAAALSLASAGLAQPRFDAAAVSTQSGTLLSYLDANASNTSGIGCYRRSATPDRTFNCLFQVIGAAGLEDRYAGDAMLTLFAPTDAAFAALSEFVSPKDYSALLRDPERLTALLDATTVSGRLSTADLSRRASGATGKGSLTALDGSSLPFAFSRFSARTNTSIAVGRSSSPKRQAYVSERATVLSNGAIVPISMLILPPGVLAD